MNLFVDPEWRKQASMTATNDLDIEKAFSDQASGFVENKVGDLMKDEYRIGFEIVKKNDDNTRMVGVFAFKVDKDLIFAPVFFINGEIKGPLLYRAESKMFVPADKEWSAYLIDSMERRDGKSRSKSTLSESAPLVQMQRLTFNPATGMGKRASGDVVEEPKVEFQVKKVSDVASKTPGVYVIEKTLDTKPGSQPELSNGASVLKMAAADNGTIELTLDGENLGVLSAAAANDIKQGFETETCGVKIASTFGEVIKKAFLDNVPDNSAQWDIMLDTVEKQASASIGLTREFLKEPGFGKPAAEALTKAASDYKFAEALASIYKTPEDLFPESYTTIEKEASAGALEICYAPETLDKSASVSKKFFADGFYIKDTRPQETMSVVFEESPGNISHPSEPGVYSLLTEEGNFIDDVFVAPYAKRDIGDDEVTYAHPVAVGSGDYDRKTPDMVAIKDGKVYLSSSMYGIKTGEASESSVLSDSVSAENAYLIYVGDNVIGPVAIADTKTVDGVTRATMYQDSWYSSADSMYKAGKEHNIIINKDLEESNIPEGVFGKDAKFIKLRSSVGTSHRGFDTPLKTSWKNAYHLDFVKLDGIGSTYSIDNWIFSKFNAKKVKVESHAFEEKKAYVFVDGSVKSARMNRLEALVKLARDMGISSTTSYTILSAADAAGAHEFYVQPTEKRASRLTLIDRPIFDEDFDSEFGVPLQPTKAYKLRVQGDQNMAPASAIGDMMNPTTATGLPDLTVATTAPEDLRALADTYHLPHVFEHGVIGTLADTFNAIAMVDKYIPKLEEGVDSLGRTKFLLHWCPDDFEKSYGRDDMANLEAEVDTNFEELGALLLKLLKKSEKNKKAEVKFESQ